MVKTVASSSSSALSVKEPVASTRRPRRAPLTELEERDLAQRMEAGKEAVEELRSKRVRGKRRSDLQAVVEDGEKARTELIVKNLPLVVTIAFTYQSAGVEMADLIGDGRVGLVKAVDAFDYRFGVPFSAHARQWIKQSINRNGLTNASVVRLPVDALYDRHRIDLAKDRLSLERGREPTVAEIAAATDLRPQRVAEILTAPRTSVAVGPGDDEALAHPRLATHDDPVDAGVDLDFLGRTEEAFNLFSPAERRVLEARTGITTGETMTVREAAEYLGMTTRAVHTLQEAAVAKTRHPRYIIQRARHG